MRTGDTGFCNKVEKLENPDFVKSILTVRGNTIRLISLLCRELNVTQLVNHLEKDLRR